MLDGAERRAFVQRQRAPWRRGRSSPGPNTFHATRKHGVLEYLAIGMELVGGENYDQYLQRNGKIDWQEAAEDFRQLITGMQAVHEQVLI